MPPLRPHQKSRTGCMQCKKRKVKCDENGHPCGSCAFRNIECRYPNSPINSPPRPPPSSDQAAQNTDRSAHQPAADLNPSNKLLLELMHQYSTETYKTFFSSPSDHHTWQTLIPRRALAHDFLLNGILSVAALHTAFTSAKNPSTARSHYLNTAMEFQSRALKPFQHAIQNISPENCDAVFAHSRIMIVTGIAFPQITVDTDKTGRSSVLENIFVLFELLQGTLEITKLTGPWLRQSSLIPDDFWGSSGDIALDTETDQALVRLDDLNRKENSGDPERYAVIETAVVRLRQSFQRFFGTKEPASVLTWLATMDRDFVNCLRRQEHLPILVLVHWGVLLAGLDGEVWWASNSGTALVADALGVLAAGNADFGVAGVWPRKKLGL